MDRSVGIAAFVIVVGRWPHIAWGQQPSGGQQPTGGRPATLDDTPPEAGDEELGVPDRKLIKFNEFEGEVDTTRMAGIEAYYRPGPLLVATDYYFLNVPYRATRGPNVQRLPR